MVPRQFDFDELFPGPADDARPIARSLAGSVAGHVNKFCHAERSHGGPAPADLGHTETGGNRVRAPAPARNEPNVVRPSLSLSLSVQAERLDR